MAVESELKKFGLHPTAVALGEAEIAEDISEAEKESLEEVLNRLGFELINDKKSRLIEQIKTLVVDVVFHQSEPLRINLSAYLAEKLRYEYSYLSNLFSEGQGITIEQYFIAQRIEKVKELLVYNELSLSQIADHMGYSSVSHLSKQFKKVTGLRPTQFKNLKGNKRRPLDEL